MYPVYLNSTTEILKSFTSFKNCLIEICNSHRKEGRALAFAFILYDFENPQLSKILKDDDYWLTLHNLSGPYLTVFSLNYNKQQVEYKERTSKAKLKGNITNDLSAITKKFNLSESSKVLTNKYFGDIEVQYPSILFFQVNNEEITDRLLIQLNEETVEQGFIELKTYIKSAVEALQSIDSQYKNNINEIFDNLEISVRSTKSMIKANVLQIT